jgi:hypothetical protein
MVKCDSRSKNHVGRTTRAAVRVSDGRHRTTTVTHPGENGERDRRRVAKRERGWRADTTMAIGGGMTIEGSATVTMIGADQIIESHRIRKLVDVAVGMDSVRSGENYTEFVN